MECGRTWRFDCVYLYYVILNYGWYKKVTLIHNVLTIKKVYVAMSNCDTGDMCSDVTVRRTEKVNS